jgi:hypothetical protein
VWESFWILKKAFDVVPHDILLNKLKKVGITGTGSPATYQIGHKQSKSTAASLTTTT